MTRLRTYLTRERVAAAVSYCLLHRKQLASAVALGAGLVEAVQKAH